MNILNIKNNSSVNYKKTPTNAVERSIISAFVKLLYPQPYNYFISPKIQIDIV